MCAKWCPVRQDGHLFSLWKGLVPTRTSRLPIQTVPRWVPRQGHRGSRALGELPGPRMAPAQLAGTSGTAAAPSIMPGHLLHAQDPHGWTHRGTDCALVPPMGEEGVLPPAQAAPAGPLFWAAGSPCWPCPLMCSPEEGHVSSEVKGSPPVPEAPAPGAMSPWDRPSVEWQHWVTTAFPSCSSGPAGGTVA